MQMLMRAARRSGIAWALAVGLATTASAAADLGPSLQAFLAKAAETAPAVKGDTSGPELLAFYQERNFQPIWLDGAKASKKARDLIEILSSARADGLEPADYATARLKGMVEAASGTDPAQLESLLSFAAVHYGNDLAAGTQSRRLDGHYGTSAIEWTRLSPMALRRSFTELMSVVVPLSGSFSPLPCTALS